MLTYCPCGRHADALSRMDFDRAFDIATDCPDCIVTAEER